MVGTLPPLVQEAPLAGSLAVFVYVLSSLGAGALVGMLFGIAGRVLAATGAPAASGLLLLIGACAGVDLLRLPVRLPERRGQLPATWIYNYGPYRAAALYGAGMGSGLGIFVSYAGFYALLTWAALQGPAGAARLVALYAAANALPVALAALAAKAGSPPPLHGARLSRPLLQRAAGLLAAWLTVAAWLRL
jgi:hypothetical protein